MQIEITVHEVDEEGCEVEETLKLPAKYEVCPRCEGKGAHDHEAFSNGLTHADFAEDPDFLEDYMRGCYDVPCSECKGLRVVPVIDRERIDEETVLRAERWENQQAAIAREKAWERRMRERGIEY